MGDAGPSPAACAVVGYGSDLRRDDGAGRRAVEAVAARGLAGVRVRSVHQLTPELAADVAGCRVAVFVDASPHVADVEVRRLSGATPDASLSHHVDARALLDLVPAVGRPPAQAWTVAIPASDLGIGTGLSPATADAVDEAVDRIVALCTAAPPQRPRPSPGGAVA